MIREQERSAINNGKPPRNKSEAVRRALATGLTSPTAVVIYVREQFGMEVSPNLVSGIKGDQKRGKQPGKVGRPAGPGSYSTARLERLEFRAEPCQLSLQDLRSLLGLAARVGGLEVLKEFLGELARVKS